MGLFSQIVDRIFHHHQAHQQAPTAAARPQATPAQAQAQPQPQPVASQGAHPRPTQPQATQAQATQAQAPEVQGAQPQAAQPQAAQGAGGQAGKGAAPLQGVDVEAVLNQLAQQKGGGGNWRASIVDLLKLLDLDSSLQARKALADELGVHAGQDGSAQENIALQHAVMEKLAQNGGRVPESLRHAA